MTNNESARKGGVSFYSLLFLILLVLKLTHVIDWSWWAITLPLWGPLAISLVAVALYIFVSLL